MISQHPITDRFMQMQRGRIRRHLICTAVGALSLFIVALAAVRGDQLSGDLTSPYPSYSFLGKELIAKIDALQTTLNEMNERQKSVVVKQHDAITAALTAEIQRAVKEIKENR